VLLDLTALSGIEEVDEQSGIVQVLAGTFGDAFEAELQEAHGLTVGHWPQSMTLSTVGGWLACRGAGQLSNRYGKIEDIVIGLEAVLADGRVIRTGGQPRQAVGPDLTQLFVGSEGTLGVITRAWLQAWPTPTHTARSAWGFESFGAALDAMRRIMRRGAQPAVLRLYDGIESNRNFGVEPTVNVLLAYDEGDQVMVDAGMVVVDQECAAADRLDDALVEQWFGHRNDVAALEALISKGYVVDTMEISAPWSRLDAIYAAATAALTAVPGTLAASAHQSHSYPTGACLYFTFAAQVEPDQRETYYRQAWDAGTRAVLDNGGSLSHHHGVGLNRARFVRDALGDGLDVLADIRRTLDPHAINNPGKLGLPDPFGEANWPAP
jgi:alkyldihydroxyacetonephosphate synthase